MGEINKIVQWPINSNSLLLIKALFSQVLGMAIAFIFAMVGARMMSVNEFGDLRFIMTLLPILMAITLPGYDSVVLKNTLLRNKVNLLTVFFTRICFGLLGSLAIFIYLSLFQDKLDGSLKFFLIITAFLLPFYETGTGYKNFLIGRGLKNQALSLFLGVRVSILTVFITLIAIIFLFKLNSLYVYPAFLLSAILPTLAIFILVSLRRYGVLSSLKDMRNDNYLASAMMISLGGFVFTFGFSLDKFIVYHKLGAAYLASYSILTMVPVELAKTFDSIVPLFYRKLFFSAREKIKINYGLASIVLIIFFSLYVLIFHYASPFVFGKSYQYGFYSVFIASMLFFSSCVELYYVHKIFAKKHQGYYLLFSVVNLIISALFLSLGVAAGGVYGLIPCLFLKQVLVSPIFSAFIKG